MKENNFGDVANVAAENNLGEGLRGWRGLDGRYFLRLVDEKSETWKALIG